MKKASLVIRVAADKQITDAVENQPEGAEDYARLIGVVMELVFVIDVIFVLDVKQRLDDLDHDGEAKWRHKGANNHHRQDVNASPTESVF